MKPLSSSTFDRCAAHLCLAGLCFAFAPRAALAQSAQPSLEIVVESGHVSVTPSDILFASGELEAIRSRAATKWRDSGLGEHADLHVTIRGEAVRELQAQLRHAGAGDTRPAVDAFFDAYVERTGSRELTPPVEVIIGRNFALQGAAMPGSVVAIGSNGTIDGAISDLVLVGSSARLGPQANVRERLMTLGSRLERDPRATVGGQELELSASRSFTAGIFDRPAAASAPPSVGARIAGALFGALASLAYGLLLVRFAPVFSARASARTRSRPWSSLGGGMLSYLAIIPGALLLVLSVLGIVLLPLYFPLIAVLVWAGYVTSAIVIGELAARSQRGWLQLAIGLLILGVTSFVPFLGGLLVFAATTAGFGGVMQALYAAFRARRRKPRPTEAGPTATPAPSAGALQVLQ